MVDCDLVYPDCKEFNSISNPKEFNPHDMPCSEIQADIDTMWFLVSILIYSRVNPLANH